MSEDSGFCPRCGAKVETGDAFCVNCGASLKTGGTSEGRTSSADTKAGDGKGKLRSRVLSVIAVIAIVYVIFFMPGKDGDTVRNYADAAASLVKQTDRHEEMIYLGYDIPGFEEELSGFQPSEVSVTLMGEDVMYRTYRQSFRYDGNPRHGERSALTAYPEGAEIYLNKSGQEYSSLRLKIRMKYFITKSQEDELQKKVEEILAGLHLDGKSDYEKVRAIYNYICSNVTYDYVNLGNNDYLPQYTAYAALFDHTAVCSGVAELFYVMAAAAGVEAHIKTSADHAWNFVKVDGLYYYLDATWDLGRPESEYQYFLKGKSDFILNIEEISHRFTVTYDPHGFLNYLNHVDDGYSFSEYAYTA